MSNILDTLNVFCIVESLCFVTNMFNQAAKLRRLHQKSEMINDQPSITVTDKKVIVATFEHMQTMRPVFYQLSLGSHVHTSVQCDSSVPLPRHVLEIVCAIAIASRPCASRCVCHGSPGR